MRILIVEDDADQRELLTRVLRYAKGKKATCFEVDAVCSKGDAEQSVAETHYDFVLLDYCLANGCKDSAALSARLSRKGIPHAFYTANIPMIKTGSVPIGIPIWQKATVGVPMDLVTKICDYYQTFAEASAESPRERRFLGIRIPRLKKHKSQ